MDIENTATGNVTIYLLSFLLACVNVCTKYFEIKSSSKFIDHFNLLILIGNIQDFFSVITHFFDITLIKQNIGKY